MWKRAKKRAKPDTTRMPKIATLASAWAITEESINIDDHLNDFFNVTGSGVFSSDELSLDRDEKAEKNSKVVINWLIKLVNDL